ncbi:MAG: hypothetical protein Kow0069_06010 [Promethearchaeota archaeon]
MALPYDLSLKMVGWGTTMVVCGLLGTVFLFRSARKGALESTKKVNRGIALFFYAYVFTRLFFFMSDLERRDHGETIVYARWVVTAYLFSLSSILFLISVGERYLLTTERKWLSKLTLALLGACATFAVASYFVDSLVLLGAARTLMYASSAIFALTLAVVYGKLILQSTGAIRRNSILTMSGLVITVVGILIDSEFLFRLLGNFIWLPGILASVGLLIFAFGQRTIR